MGKSRTPRPGLSAAADRQGPVIKKILFVALAVALTIVIGLIDLVTGSNIKILAFYLIPIFLAAFYLNSAAGYLFSLISSMITFTIEYHETGIIETTVIINNIMIVAMYCTVVYLITKFKDRNTVIENNLVKREIILRDIHHRMKNQMSSLLSLIRLSNTGDPEKLVENITTRIHAYFALYESLCYDSESMTRVNLRDYLNKLSENIIHSLAMDGSIISVSINGGDFFLDNSKLILLGLITNELMTNSLRHAFTGKERGAISIEISREQRNRMILRYRDNGSGFDPDSANGNQGLGMIVIRSLVEQLKGKIAYRRDAGSDFTLSFDSIDIFNEG